MEMRVKDGGKSESQVVITWIRLELTGDISRRENGQTSTGSSSTRRLEKLFKGEKQMAVMKRIAATAAEFDPEPLAVLMTGASSHSGEGWHAINWQQVNQNVKRLQARIVQATQEGRWGKVKALQRLLTHSFSGKALAVKRVTENQGKRTPGIDGKTWSKPVEKITAVNNLRQHGYKAAPLRRVYIPKANGKKRPLGIPTIRDRAMQALYKLALDPIAETTGDLNSYGFRRERCTADAIGYCFITLGRRRSAQWVLEGDIKGCFDHINHDWLLANIPLEKKILRQWLKAGYMEAQTLFPTESGTPQGGIISPVLANMMLDGLEKALIANWPPTRKGKAQVYLTRYADDFIITANQREILDEDIKPKVEAFLAERGLSLSPEKTVITHIKEGFDFLGQNIRKYNGKLLIKPAKANVQRFLAKVQAAIRKNLHATPRQLINLLNPMIRGWANYHRHVVSKDTYGKVDSRIFWMLWRWARRRHPNKRKAWIRRRYFTNIGNRQWVFFDQLPAEGEKHRLIRLFRASEVTIERHHQIRQAANPYDPA